MPALPSSDEAKWVCNLCHRKLTTPWSKTEVIRFRDLKKHGFFVNKDDLAAIARYYEHERKKGLEGFYCRDVCSFLGKAPSQLDRALDWCKRHPIHKPRKVIPLPLLQSPLPIEHVAPEQLAKFNADYARHKAGKQ